MPYFVYILRCLDGSFYIGHTNDLASRLHRHATCRGATHTSEHRPRKLVYTEECESRSAAMARERQLKGWTRAKKEALFAGDLSALRRL
jgi:predicted GIY-YIG superfamily endonuclease